MHYLMTFLLTSFYSTDIKLKINIFLSAQRTQDEELILFFLFNGHKLHAQLMRLDTNFLLSANDKRLHACFNVGSRFIRGLQKLHLEVSLDVPFR